MTFSERIRRRKALWWGPSYVDRLHRIRERVTLRSHSDPDDRWRCCEHWQRSLINKWNGREFAGKHGCRVPTLYWHGRCVARLPLDDLPDRYVIKPAFGTSGNRAYVMSGGVDLLHRVGFSGGGLRESLIGTYGRVSLVVTLVEEFVGAEGAGDLATDYKFYMFGDVVGAVEVINKQSAKDYTCTFYTPSWNLFDYAFTTPKYRAGEYQPPPTCLDEMLRHARTLGVAYGTFVRVDFYATDRGCVFGEFSSTPNGGEGFAETADRYLGALWRQHCPDET